MLEKEVIPQNGYLTTTKGGAHGWGKWGPLSIFLDHELLKRKEPGTYGGEEVLGGTF